MYSSDVGIVHTKPAVLAALVGILRKAWRLSGVLQWNLVMQLWSGTLKCCLWLIPSTPNVEMLMWMVWFHLVFFFFFPPSFFPLLTELLFSCLWTELRAVLTILLSIVVCRAFLTVLFPIMPYISLSLWRCLFIQFSEKNLFLLLNWEAD